MINEKEICGKNYEIANGEHVSSCHKEKEHSGNCEGYCLGSKYSWDGKYISDREAYLAETSHSSRIDVEIETLNFMKLILNQITLLEIF